MRPSISIYLDTRKAKTNNLFPVKLRVYLSKGKQRTQKLYPLGIDLSVDDFERSYKATKPRGDHKDLKLKLIGLEQRAIDVADSLKVFILEKFERELFRDKLAANDVSYHYKEYIKGLQERGKVTTASSYHLSLKSLLAYANSKNRISSDSLYFDNITVDFLSRYERWMQEQGRSRTTVGIYLRPLRAIFNNAIETGDIHKDTYPFGKRKYQIPAGKNIKKALSKEQLGILFKAQALIPEQEKARDFWFFSYACNGMNIKDIANLKFRDIKEDRLIFSRAKTVDTSKSNHKSIMVALTSFPLSVIEKYGNADKGLSNFVFPILTNYMDHNEQDRAIKNFTRFINQHIKNLAKSVKLTEDISTYWARHSFATNAVRNGASLEFIQESLGHNDLKTTLSYWGGFEESVKQEIADKLMDFS
ncbi:tyrosine-type recombinase/integrase [Pontibacter arcticus]|uniref:Integrase n=1 Tax=Pontibacter arcticus TaxID=2080288 RepID=A0A364RJP5_9BACT|nr:site-specific integrase [Pontibacter arcticus]RAU84512.1 integrase [Pontibacter arcticus]